MGLDSSIYIKTFIANEPAIQVARATELPDELIETDRFITANVEIQVAYWRKFNALHGWVVNQANGEDNCQPIELDLDHIKRLKDICQDVQNDPSKADELLPPQSGFFFGSTEVDAYYMEQLEYTIGRLNALITYMETCPRTCVIYQASW